MISRGGVRRKILAGATVAVAAFLVSACSRHYSAADASTRIENDLAFPYSISLPAGASVLNGYCFGGRDRGDVFVLHASKAALQGLEGEIKRKFSASLEFTLTMDKDVSQAPFSFGRPSTYPLSKLSWWKPWLLQDPVVLFVERRTDFQTSGCWIAISYLDERAYVIVFSS